MGGGTSGNAACTRFAHISAEENTIGVVGRNRSRRNLLLRRKLLLLLLRNLPLLLRKPLLLLLRKLLLLLVRKGAWELFANVTTTVTT